MSNYPPGVTDNDPYFNDDPDGLDEQHPDPKDLTEAEFKQRLFEAGWSQIDIDQEWENIQNDEESGYDGP